MDSVRIPKATEIRYFIITLDNKVQTAKLHKENETAKQETSPRHNKKIKITKLDTTNKIVIFHEFLSPRDTTVQSCLFFWLRYIERKVLNKNIFCV